MPCGCFGGGSAGGVRKQDPGDKYIPRDTLQGHDTKPQPITTKPPVPLINPIPAPEKVAIQSSVPVATAAAPPPPSGPPTSKGGSTSSTDASGPQDDPDKANRRRDVVASYYSDECELLAYKNTGSRPTSQVGSNDDGEASPPVATSSPAPSSPASARSAASTRADLVEKRREFFKPLIGDVQEPQWTGTGSRSVAVQQQQQQQAAGVACLPHPHAQPLLEAHDRQLVNYKEPTVKDVVHKFEHLPEQITPTPKPRETEVRLGRNSSTTVTVLHNTDKHQTPKPVHMVQHKDAGELTPDQQKQEQQLVNKAAVHQQLLAGVGQVNLRPTPPKPREIPDIPPPVTITAPDQPHDDNCIIQTTLGAYAALDDTAPAPVPAKPPPKPAHLPPDEYVLQSQPAITESRTLVTELEPIVSEPKHIVSETDPPVTELQSVVTKPEPVVTEPERVTKLEPVVAEPKPAVTEPEPPVAEPKAVVAEPDPVVAEPDPVVAEPTPVVAEPKLVVAEPKPVVDESKPVVAEPKANDAEPEPENGTELKHFEQPKSAVDKSEPVLVSAHVSGTVSDFTHTKLFTESKSDTCEIPQTRDSKAFDTKALAAVTEPTSAAKEVSFVTEESELISVLKENEKNIFSSQSEQIPLDSHSEITTKIIHSEPSYIIESKSVITKNQEIVSHKENSMHGNQQVSFDLGETISKEENKSVISKADPCVVDNMPLEFLAGISQSKQSVEVKSTNDGTMHTETTKSVITDGDSNMMMHTKTVKTTIISSSEPLSEISSTQALMTEPLYDRTLACISDSSSSLVVEGSSEPSFLLTDGSSTHIIKSNADLMHDDQQQQPDIQSALHSSLPPMTQIGSSPSPSSSPSPRNSSHSSPTSPCASSPSPPASPDSSRAHKLSMVEPLTPQMTQEAQESCPALSQDGPSPDDHVTHNSALNNQDGLKVQDLKDNILVSGPPSSPMDSRNPLTCNEADVTAPVSLEDDGLGSEIDDALDSMDCLSEEGNSHSHHHHHQSVPAPPPPSSAS